MGTANLTEQLPEGAKPDSDGNTHPDSRRRVFPEVRRVPQNLPNSPPPLLPKQTNKSHSPHSGAAEGAPARPGLDDAPLLRTPLDARICICLNAACILGFLRHTLVYTFCYVMRLSCTQTDTWALQSELDYHEINNKKNDINHQSDYLLQTEGSSALISGCFVQTSSVSRR